jgi:hypothetical protein
MPMLHRCASPDCQTFTLSTYCFEHERSIRAEVEAERAQFAAQAADPGVGRARAPAELKHGA